MSRHFSIELVFLFLAFVFWAITLNLMPVTLVCVFYSITVGLIWGIIARLPDADELSWKHILPPFVLVLIMMFSAQLKTIASSDVVMITAMALIHVRAAVFSFNRLSGSALVFPSLQFAAFLYCLAFLFQRKVLPFTIRTEVFWASTLFLGTIGLGTLLMIKRNQNAKPTDQAINSPTGHS